MVGAAGLAGCSRKRPLAVGAKTSPAQAILAEAVAQHLEGRLGAPVERRLNLGDTLLAHQALITGVVDLYPEYSGLALTVIFKLPHESDPAIVFERVRNEYRIRSAVEWLEPLGCEGGFVMVVRADEARRAGLAALSDAARGGPGWKLGLPQEFLVQPAWFSRLMSVYALPLAGPTKTLEAGALYQALSAGEVNMVAGSPTDPQLESAEFQALKDDRGAFAPCQAALAVRAEALARTPGLRGALAQLAGKFTTAVLRTLARSVQLQHRPAAEVAAEALRQAGLR